MPEERRAGQLVHYNLVEKEVVDQIRKEYTKGMRNLVRWQMSTGVGCAYRK